MYDIVHNIDAAVDYKPFTYRQSQIDETVRRN